MKNVIREWIEGAGIRAEGLASPRLLGRLATAAATVVNLSVAGGAAMLVLAGSPRDLNASEPVSARFFAGSPAEFEAARVASNRLSDETERDREGASLDPADAALGDDLELVSPHVVAHPPKVEIVDIAARMMEVAFGDPKAGEAFVRTVEAAVECFDPKGSPPVEACMIRAPGVSFDMMSGVYLVGIDPDTGLVADWDGERVVARQVGDRLEVDGDNLAALFERSDLLEASVRVPGR